MTQATILYGVNDGVATTLTLDRPDRRNAMTNQMVREVYEILLDAAGDMSSPWLLSRLLGSAKARSSGARAREMII